MEYKNFLFQFLVTLFSSIICFIVQRELDRYEMKRLASVITEFIDFDIFDFNAIRKYDLFRRQRKDKRKRISSDSSKKDGSREEEADDTYDYADHKMNVLDAYPEFANLVKKLSDISKKVEKISKQDSSVDIQLHNFTTEFINTVEKNFKEIDQRFENIMEINQKLIDTNHTLEKSYETKHNNLLCSIDQLKKDKELLITQNMGIRLDLNKIKDDIKLIKLNDNNSNLNDSELLVKINDYKLDCQKIKDNLQSEIMENLENAATSEEFIGAIIERVEDQFIKNLDDNKIFDKYVNKFTFNTYSKFENDIRNKFNEFSDLVENKKLVLAEEMNDEKSDSIIQPFPSITKVDEIDFGKMDYYYDIQGDNEPEEEEKIIPKIFDSDMFNIKKVLSGEIKEFTIVNVDNYFRCDDNPRLEYYYKFGSNNRTYRLKDQKLYSTYF